MVVMLEDIQPCKPNNYQSGPKDIHGEKTSPRSLYGIIHPAINRISTRFDMGHIAFPARL